MTLYEALETGAQRSPEKSALLWKEQAWTYSRLAREVRRLANAWTGQSGYAACFLNKRPEWVITFVAGGGAGFTFVPCNPCAGSEFLKSQLLEAPPAWIVIEDRHLAEIAALADEIGIRPRFVVVDGPRRDEPRYVDWETLISSAAESPRVPVAAGEIAYLNMTSGTSGRPKSALTTHANIHANVISACAKLGLTQDDVFLCAFPANLHPHETIARGVLMGGTVLLEDAGSGLDGLWQALGTGAATTVMANPAIYRLMAEFKAFARVRLFESGGSPCPAELIRIYRERFGAPLIPVWGSTETTGIVLAATPLPQQAQDGLLGSPCPSYRVKVQDGELLVAGPAVVSRYLGSGRGFADGWLHTGDLVKERHGNLYFAGRADSTFKSGGLKVHPEEVEAVLLRHPAIRDAAVVGVPDTIRGLAVKALLVLRAGATLSREELVAHCLPQLETHRIPRLVSFVESLPRAESGKLLRSRLNPEA